MVDVDGGCGGGPTPDCLCDCSIDAQGSHIFRNGFLPPLTISEDDDRTADGGEETPEIADALFPAGLVVPGGLVELVPFVVDDGALADSSGTAAGGGAPDGTVAGCGVCRDAGGVWIGRGPGGGVGRIAGIGVVTIDGGFGGCGGCGGGPGLATNGTLPSALVGELDFILQLP